MSFWSGCRGETSMTMTRLDSPICGAARPTPSAAYIVSAMSSRRRRRSSSTRSTGFATSCRTGSGQMTISRTIRVLSGSPRPRSNIRARRAHARRGSVAEAPQVLGAQRVVGEDLAGVGDDVEDLAQAGLEAVLAEALVAPRVELGREPRRRVADLVRRAEPAHAEH